MSNSEINYSMASDERTEASVTADGVEVSSGTTKGYTHEVDKDGARPSDAPVEGDEAAEEGSDPVEDDAEDGDESTQEVNDIESFDPQDPENAEAWNKEYTREDGSLNIDRISSEFWRNIDRGDEGLNEATYEYLASKGISRADAKRYEAMALNDRDAQRNSVAAHDQELFTIAGGPDSLREALDWGKGGGYSDAQRAKFDKIMSGTDIEAKKEAIELLMGRYGKSDAYLEAQEAKKPSKPERDATRGQGGARPAAKPFKDRAEWRAARRAAGDDTAKLRLVDARAKASGF